MEDATPKEDKKVAKMMGHSVTTLCPYTVHKPGGKCYGYCRVCNQPRIQQTEREGDRRRREKYG